MRFPWRAVLATTLLLGAAEFAVAANVRTTTKHYAIGGATGDQLLKSMNRRGPKHGFLSRAIAQTAYQIDWDVKIGLEGGNCRLRRATPNMKMTYTYPQPSDNLSPAMRGRWSRFMVGVRKHEAQHGTYARQMAGAAERSLRGLRVANDPTCRKTTALMRKRVQDIYEAYEAKQIVFDQREHRQNGNIYRLIQQLTK